MIKLLLIWEEVPESLKLYLLDCTEKQLSDYQTLDNQLDNSDDFTPEQREVFEALSVRLQNEKLFECNQLPACFVVKTGYMC